MSSGHLAATQRSCIQPAQFLACGYDLTSNPAVVSAPVLVYPDSPRIKVDAQCRTAMLRVLHCEYAISAVDAEIGVTTHAVLHFVCLLCQRAGIRQRGESDAIDDGFRQRRIPRNPPDVFALFGHAATCITAYNPVEHTYLQDSMKALS